MRTATERSDLQTAHRSQRNVIVPGADSGREEWTEKVRSIIGRAACAPSSHNTQPWRFRMSASRIELWADRTRALPVNDPDDRELAISCGCALLNLRIAGASENLGVRIQLLPEPEVPDLLARVHVAGPTSVNTDYTALAPFIETRRTHRKRFARRTVSHSVIHHLMRAANAEGAHLEPLLTEEARHRIAMLVAEGDAAQWGDPHWRRELAAWLRPRSGGDGLGLHPVAVTGARLVVRMFDMGRRIGAQNRRLAEASPLLAVLTTDGDKPHDWLIAGQALQRVLLAGCRQGLQASYLNQPVQVARLRPTLQHLVASGVPQILLRLGYPAEEIPPTARRAVDEVIEPDPVLP